MNIRDGYNSKKVVTFDMQDRLDNKLDKITSILRKLKAQGRNQNRPFKHKIYQGKRRGKTRNYYDQGNYQNRYRSNSGDRRISFRGRAQSDRIIEESHNMITIIEVTLGVEILEECRITEVKILEVDIEATIKLKTLEEVEIDLQKDSIQVILEETIKVVVAQDQVQEQVHIEIGLDVLSVGSMINLLKTVQT